MNSLQDLKQVFKNLGKDVSAFTGYSLEADGFTWGIVSDNPVRNGITMSTKDWKEYLKALKAGMPAPELKAPVTSEMDAVADALGIKPVMPVRIKVKKIENQITCPHCDKTGGATGMRIHHFDRCKQKKNK